MRLPEGLVRAVSTERHNAEGCLSATTLLQGVKQILLTERHWDELEDDAADRLWATWGTAVHALLEHEDENDFTEETVSREVEGVRVTGKIDNYNMASGVIIDYKTTSTWKVIYQNFEDWRLQGLIYAWLLVRNGFTVKKCRFIALLKDHSKTDAARKSGYPKNPVYVYEFDVTEKDLEEIEFFIDKKISLYLYEKELDDDLITPCTPEERWDAPSKHAVMKEGRKSAVRVFDTPLEAAALAKSLGANHYTEFRPGLHRRCLGYCVCAPFCNFYREQVDGYSGDSEES
jgi:hypothetical protein